MRRRMASASPGLPSGASFTAINLATMRWAAAHLAGQLILALAQVDDMPEQTVRRPFDIADLDDHFGPRPMHPLTIRTGCLVVVARPAACCRSSKAGGGAIRAPTRRPASPCQRGPHR